MLEVLSNAIQSAENMLQDLRTKRGLSVATGVQLDALGKIVGQAREGLADEAYRARIRLRIAQNNSEGTPQTLIDLFAALTQSPQVELSELRSAQFTLVAVDPETDIPDGDIADAMNQAKVAGVHATLVRAVTPAFAFAGDADPGKLGFGPLPTGYPLMAFGAPGAAPGEFSNPAGVAVGLAGKIYVADSSNSRLQVFDEDGVLIEVYAPAGSGNGQVSFAYGLAVDADGYTYVADTGNSRVQKFDLSDNYLLKFGGVGSGDGQFASPEGIAVDDDGFIYVTDAVLDRVQKFDATGAFVAKWGITGNGAGEFDGPVGIAVRDGRVYVADTGNGRVQVFNTDGDFLEAFSTLGADLSSEPIGVGVDQGQAVIYVTDGDLVKAFSSSGGAFLSSSDGFEDLPFDNPQGLFVTEDAVYLSDRGNSKIRKISLCTAVAGGKYAALYE